MTEVLLATPGWVMATVLVALFGVASLGLVGVARRVTHRRPPGERHNEVLGMLLGAAGTFYAIVVALSVFVVWSHYTSAQQAEIDQGTALMSLYQDATILPYPQRSIVEDLIREYTSSMIDDEFPALARGRSSDVTEASLGRMNARVRTYLGTTNAQDELSAAERAQYQLILTSSTTMPPLLWSLLLVSCFLVLMMAALLFMDDVRYHGLGSVLLGCTLGVAVFLILVADHPFDGPMRLGPTDLSRNLHSYAIADRN